MSDNKNLSFLIVAAVSLLGGMGCATITRGTSEAFVINSKPSGASVRLSSGETLPRRYPQPRQPGKGSRHCETVAKKHHGLSA
ncbi:MAG: hypothetical protein ACE5ET_03430 [Gammaproteobacteria bacterium]